MPRDFIARSDSIARLRLAVERMKEWAHEHGEADTAGLMDDEWMFLAVAALHVDYYPDRFDNAYEATKDHWLALEHAMTRGD